MKGGKLMRVTAVTGMTLAAIGATPPAHAEATAGTTTARHGLGEQPLRRAAQPHLPCPSLSIG
ncbi:hypothetical protein SAMN05428945_5823 [Streptomyces sp. 2224.1]|nr:hypothetical protein BX261_6729 [Streptomyces sp. 2321.6]SDQ77834.1 hypothetical protein SAMN05216511_0522 [Streptomyces sp. KS_16]SED54914.1 hypothetical protein SAMN05428954_0501 [Streptomyces sp. 2112.3]SED86483.1 hypothetical protein SAMN05428945_5823 [Streptomyces sp. 2224.1]SEE04422.1 hypothetical protein SAMN05428940_6754 [Streptomyces sp. 2133.1]SNC73742.1 hypothetical protein SAMN06272741_6658 [Streptomyces sp. 2114.4]